MSFTIQTHHVHRRILYRNGFVWSLGNSLTSGTLLNCMLQEMGFASPYVTATIYAAPFLCKILQLFLPYFLEYFHSRQTLCIRLYWLQVASIWLMLASFWFLPARPLTKLILLLFFWGISSLFEIMAFSVFLSWNRQLFPGKTLGRFYSRHQLWLLLGEVLPLLLLLGLNLGLYALIGNLKYQACKLGIYTFLTILGTVFIAASTFWLKRLPDFRFEIPSSQAERIHEEWRRLWKPFQKKEFWPFLVYGALFSLFTQTEQVAQFKFQYHIMALGPILPFLGVSSLRIITRGLQILPARWVGKWVDRAGTLRVMILAQILTAIPPLFYVSASEVNSCAWLFLYLAAVVWASYVGLNAALPKLQTDFSDPNDDTPWLCAYGLAGSIAGLPGVFLGAWIHDCFSMLPHFYAIFFFIAFMGRLSLVLPLLWAKRWNYTVSQ